MDVDLIKTIELTKDAVGLLIPVQTGFVALFGGTIAYLWKGTSSVATPRFSGPLAATILLSLVLSLFMTLGVMNLCLKASFLENTNFYWIDGLSPKQLMIYTHRMLYAACVLFGVAIALSAVFYKRLLGALPPSTASH